MQKMAIAAISALLLILPTVLAEDLIETSLSEDSAFVYTGETATVELTIKNNQEKSDVVTVSIVPSFLSKIGAFPETAAINLPISSKSSATVKLFFSVLPEAEETSVPALFKIFASSVSDTSISSNKTVQINVLRTSPVYLSDLKISKSNFNPEENLQVNAVLTNTRSSPSDAYKLEIMIKKDNTLVGRFDELISEIPGKISQTITKSHTFDTYASPGIYTITVNLRDSLNTLIGVKSFDVKVNEINKTASEVMQDFKILTATKTIKVKNVGNVPTSVSLKETVPSIAKDWVTPETNPISTNAVGDSVVYEWLVRLAPGQETTIKYQISLAGVWLGLLVVFSLIYIAFKFVFTPSITKKVRSHGILRKGSEIIVTLEIKNHSLSEIKDLVISDVVPQLAEVVAKFDTLKPVIRKSAEGTQLGWKLDSLKVAEERIINYRIKSTVDVLGSLELPSAKMGYYDSKRVRKFVVSHVVSAGE